MLTLFNHSNAEFLPNLQNHMETLLTELNKTQKKI